MLLPLELNFSELWLGDILPEGISTCLLGKGPTMLWLGQDFPRKAVAAEHRSSGLGVSSLDTSEGTVLFTEASLWWWAGEEIGASRSLFLVSGLFACHSQGNTPRRLDSLFQKTISSLSASGLVHFGFYPSQDYWILKVQNLGRCCGKWLHRSSVGGSLWAGTELDLTKTAVIPEHRVMTVRTISINSQGWSKRPLTGVTAAMLKDGRGKWCQLALLSVESHFCECYLSHMCSKKSKLFVSHEP